jgi:hypothetical protein
MFEKRFVVVSESSKREAIKNRLEIFVARHREQRIERKRGRLSWGEKEKQEREGETKC